jgi:hypothetical protein
MEPISDRPAAPRLDLVTPLPLADCLKAIRRGAARITDQRLAVHIDGDRVRVVCATQRRRDGQAAGIWLFRFQGHLTPTDIGTHVEGIVVRNKVLDSLLALPGIITGVFCVLGIALAVPFVAALSLILLVLLAGFYVYYQRLLTRQTCDLVNWVQEWLLIPQGRAGGTLP